MDIGSVRHKALRRFLETGRSIGLPGNLIERLRNMVAFISAIEDVEELFFPPNYGAHRLTGDRDGVWSLTVSKNWRMTFWIDEAGEIRDLDLEDYH